MKKHPMIAVDIVIIYCGGIVLVKRKNPPFKGYWALCGGFVEYGETVEEAAIREALEETGLKIKELKLVGVYSDPNRDPRGHVISVAFIAKGEGKLKAASDAKSVAVFNVNNIPSKLAFDHSKILRDALKLVKNEY
ncbi:NUDIX hydrolase [archaeon]|nr:MAG: NUDIX hydrolase [archaeon]RLG65943.1 MAG: NUDIX hydrolase [archaeon]HDM24047.1 NUDIX hydrolase [Candidatus Bathyarchaeota archaeon]